MQESVSIDFEHGDVIHYRNELWVVRCFRQKFRNFRLLKNRFCSKSEELTPVQSTLVSSVKKQKTVFNSSLVMHVMDLLMSDGN